MARSDSENADRERLAIRADIYLCQECSERLNPGGTVICLTDGYVDASDVYEPENRRFFHVDCWKNSEYIDTDS